MKRRVVFMGTPDFAVMSLDAIVRAGYEVASVVTVPDRLTGRGMKLTYSPVKEYALQHELPLLQPEKLRDESFLEALRTVQADIFVVVAFRMLPQVVWSMPPMGTFNLHASLLPQYRGAAPINWAIINGESESGVTTFLLNEKIDEGSLLLQKKTAITSDDTAETLHDRLATMGAELVIETLDGLYNGTITPHKQSEPARLMPAPKLFKQDCAIDWHKSAKEIHNFVRGLSPYPAATTSMTDNKGSRVEMKIFEVNHEIISHEETIGSIITDNKKSLKIAVSDGFIELFSLQISGKKKINVDEFLRGYNIIDWKLNI
ncbi:MAG: methionyl-tRNA formyltransferase [Bacteroidales bacterium]|nr:methionyl-tRNA formyltransferase [Bacteroidales bacterium]